MFGFILSVLVGVLIITGGRYLYNNVDSADAEFGIAYWTGFIVCIVIAIFLTIF